MKCRKVSLEAVSPSHNYSPGFVEHFGGKKKINAFFSVLLEYFGLFRYFNESIEIIFDYFNGFRVLYSRDQ